MAGLSKKKILWHCDHWMLTALDRAIIYTDKELRVMEIAKAEAIVSIAQSLEIISPQDGETISWQLIKTSLRD